MVSKNKFYNREYFGVFKEINQAVVDIQKKYGKENVTTALNTSDRNIMNFYFERWSDNVPFDFYAGDSSSFISDMLKKIDSCKTPYFIYGWSNFMSPYEIPELIKRKFPCIVYDEKHFNSQITLFGKNDTCKRDTLFYSHISFEKDHRNFRIPTHMEFDSTKIDSTHSHSGKYSLTSESKNKFCITLRTSVKRIFIDNAGCVNVSAWIYSNDKFNAQLVLEIGDPNSKRDWHAKLLPKFIKQTGKWQEVFATFELPSSAYPDDELKIYLWNPGKNSFYLDDFTVSSFADSKYDYYAPSFRK